MFRTVLVLASGLAGLAVVPAFADAQGPAYNQGSDGWWPGGYGYPPVTVQAWNYPACSVTAYGPTFVSGLARQNYGAGTSCAGGIGTKSLAVSDRVLGQDGRTWFTITGSTVSERPVSYNPVHAILNRVAVLGHEYRTIATAGLVVPTCYGGSESVAITAVSRRLAP